MAVGSRLGECPVPSPAAWGEQQLPELHSIQAGPAQPWLHLLEVSQPLCNGGGIPNGLCRCNHLLTSKLRFFPPCSLRRLSIAQHRQVPSSFQHLTTQGYPPPHLCSRGLHTPARQPLQVPQCHTDLWQVSLSLPMLLLLLPTSITQWHSKQGMYTGEMVGGYWR